MEEVVKASLPHPRALAEFIDADRAVAALVQQLCRNLDQAVPGGGIARARWGHGRTPLPIVYIEYPPRRSAASVPAGPDNPLTLDDRSTMVWRMFPSPSLRSAP